VAVHVVYGPGDLVIQVDDDGAGSPQPDTAANGSGSGIAGMTERARSLGGTLRAGPRPDGGFRVRAWLPLGEQPS
jgi:signal transduction histidine kinase